MANLAPREPQKQHHAHYGVLLAADRLYYVEETQTGNRSKSYRSDREAEIALFSLALRDLINE